ncbi:hypothetical protein [Collimonas arenae]|uniref:hypothetical protein n=1 Tax=Collimonas arenae TaxID=279058 RepID=UPI000FE13DE5|nr:hypothetical protein [Collimonas arenae]
MDIKENNYARIYALLSIINILSFNKSLLTTHAFSDSKGLENPAHTAGIFIYSNKPQSHCHRPEAGEYRPPAWRIIANESGLHSPASALPVALIQILTK